MLLRRLLRARDDSDDSDADISGPGVIFGAILANLLTVIATLISLRVAQLWRSDWRRSEGRLLRLPLRSWIEILPDFVLSLSDQQLLTGLVLLAVGLGTFYNTSVHEGANNLWVAGDIVVFSSVTHAASLIALRPYFRKHRVLAMIRVVLMWITFALYVVVAVGVLSQNKPKHSAKLPFWLAQFWQGAAYIDLFGVTWMYFITYMPIFVSDKAAEVRELIASDSHIKGNVEALDVWDVHTKLRRQTTRERHIFWRMLKNLSPYKIVRSKVSSLFKRFASHYLRAEGLWYRRILWLVAEIIFPWRLTIVPVSILWAFGLATMVLNLWQGHNLSVWDFGQLISPIFTILPIYNLIVAITQTKKKTEHDLETSSSMSDARLEETNKISNIAVHDLA